MHHCKSIHGWHMVVLIIPSYIFHCFQTILVCSAHWRFLWQCARCKSMFCWLIYLHRNFHHDRPVELRCRGTISVEQSSCCSTETRDDSAHFQETTEGLSVPHLMCWQTEGTFTTARRCCDSDAGYKTGDLFAITALTVRNEWTKVYQI